MKRLLVSLLTGLMFTVLPFSLQAYSIDDPSGDAIGERGFESYGINIYNYTPGLYSGNITLDLFTNYPVGGISTSGWDTKAADLFIYETYYGNTYLWAIPLVEHDGFQPGTMYSVAKYHISNFFDPSSGSLPYNPNVPVRIAEIGENYGNSAIGGLTVQWIPLTGGETDYRINIVIPGYQDDPNGVYALLWGTATCANDVVAGQIPVPEPATMLLLGFGLLGLAVMKRRW